MALGKRTKIGGLKYKGYHLQVSSASGSYPIALIPTMTKHAVNGIAVTPDTYGAGDHFNIEIMSTTATVGGDVVKLIAESCFNLGKSVTLTFDFAALMMVDAGQSVRFTYINTASIAGNVYITEEVLG